MFWFATLIALAGCGRFGFEVVASQTDSGSDSGSGNADSATDVVPLGHDEDGDGIPDVSDPCPHMSGAQGDGDSDGVGDACDPNPAVGGDQIKLFATMLPGDQPLSQGFGDGVWTQLADSFEFTGDPAVGGDNNLFGQLAMPLLVGNVRVAVGIEIKAIIAGTTSDQNQLVLAVIDQTPLYFVELNQVPGVFDNAQVTFYDGTTFLPANAQNLVAGIHTGFVTLQTTQVVNTRVTFDAAWGPEAYTAQVMDTVYQGATRLELTTNNLHFEIHWLVVITSP